MARPASNAPATLVHSWAIAAAGASLLLAGRSSQAQMFNIDIDVPVAPPAMGGGVPSPAFGAAAGVPGQWNSFLVGLPPQNLADVNGNHPGVTFGVTALSVGAYMQTYAHPVNTGDYALFFNDAQQVGTISQGGAVTFTFSGLANGNYQLYTYATVPFDNGPGDSLVTVNGVSQQCTGYQPGNTFILGATHVIHPCTVSNGTLSVTITAHTGYPPAYINGFQLVPAPGTTAFAALAAAGLLRRPRRAS